MPKFGAHMSISGGCFRSMEWGQQAGCEVVQLFSKNERQWLGKPLTDDDIAKFTDARTRTNVHPVMIHDSYLINLSSPNDDLWGKSINAFRDELLRARALDVPYLNTHPGSHVGSGEQEGLDRMVTALNRLGAEGAYEGVTVLLETTAGQGTNLGAKFEHLSYLIEHVNNPDAFAVCIDTCHIFAAGYDIRTPETYAATMADFDRLVGYDRIKAMHLNDALQPLGDHKDRHAAIGEGHIGLEGFRNVVNDPRLAHLPMVLETPKSADCHEDIENIARLRGLIAQSSVVA
ncbi:MAG: deoxyribonuclease IV [Thermomicrobiales bacterium]